MYASPNGPQQSGIRLLASWTVTSLLLYNLWYLVWYLWELKSNFRNSAYRVNLALLLLVVIGFVVFINRFSNEALRSVYFIRFIISASLFAVIQYALRAQGNIAQLRLEKEQIQTENYKVQLKALQTQVDPHFLFNSLNTLRSMVRQQHTHTEQFVISLGGFYRQTLKHNDNTTLQLAKELEVLQSYLFLMKNRNEAAINIDIDIDASVKALHLPTLALQTVVENCFKHNSMSSKMPLHIKISNEKDYLVVSNNIQPKIGGADISGYGLDLLKKRYGLMNVPRGIIIEQTPIEFRVQLKLIRP